MRERSIIHVAGPPSSGKTTFIEALLESANAIVLAARCARDDALRRPRETNPKNHPELARYRSAGASGVARFTFPAEDVGSDAFFLTDLMTDYSEAVLLEGDNPLEFVDLAVFVAPAPGAREALFVRRKRDPAVERRARADLMERLLRKPGGMAELLDLTWGGPIVELARQRPALLEKTRTDLLAALVANRRLPAPKPEAHWAVADRYAGIEHAQLVVANVRHPGERSAAERLVADVARLRKEKELFDDVLGFRSSRTAPSYSRTCPSCGRTPSRRIACEGHPSSNLSVARSPFRAGRDVVDDQKDRSHQTPKLSVPIVCQLFQTRHLRTYSEERPEYRKRMWHKDQTHSAALRRSRRKSAKMAQK